jgi:methionyl-tRNA formyltransferase
LRIALEQPERVNEPSVVEQIAQARPDVVVVCAFGALIKEPLLSANELLNVHPSLLPRWRGAAPIERAIIAGDERTGVSIMRLTAGLDSGPVCLTATEPIAPDDTYGSLAARLQTTGGELLVHALDLIAAGTPPTFAEQDEEGVTYAEKISPADRLLDPGRSAAELERVVRALHPHIGARAPLADGELLGVRRARVATWGAPGEPPDGGSAGALDGGSGGTPREPPDGGTGSTPDEPLDGAPAIAPGTLTAVAGQLLYGAHDRPLELLEVQPPGARAMDADAYLRGHGQSLARR